MASTGGTHWETVGKNKKTKGQSQLLSKSQKKNFVDKMPRLEHQPPVKECSTIYDAFLEKEKDRVLSTAMKNDKPASKNIANRNGINVKKNIPNKKKKGEQEKKKTTNLNDAISKIEKSQLESVLTLSQSSFPENPEVWLKDLASFLNLKLDDVPVVDPLFKDEPADYPLSCLNKSCQSLLMSVLKGCSTETLEHLFYYSIQQIVAESAKATGAYGYKMFIQMLGCQKATITNDKLSQYLELIKTNQNQPLRCLAILWSVGQCGIKNIRSGLRVWLDVMFPSLGIRSVSAYCVDYLNRLFSVHKNLKPAYGEVSVRDYFHIMDLVFRNTHIAGDLKKRLMSLYPQLKEIAYGTSPSSNLRNFYPSYLSRLAPNIAGNMKTELLSSLCKCLMTDKVSFSLWCQMYTKHLPQSSLLMQHISDNWETVGCKIDHKLLHDTLRSFSVTNDELGSQGAGVEGLEQCTKVCKELLLKMTKPRFPWRLLFFGIILFLLSLISYDLITSPMVRASRTVQFLENYGVLAVVQQAWGRISTYAAKGYGWLLVNVPIYYAKLCAAVGPYLWFAWTKLVDGVSFLMEVTAPYRKWLLGKSIQLIEWSYAVSPQAWSTIGNYLWLSWDFFRDYSFWIWKNISGFLYLLYHWVEEHIILSEISLQSIQEALKAVLLSIQSGLNTSVQWVGSFLSSGSK